MVSCQAVFVLKKILSYYFWRNCAQIAEIFHIKKKEGKKTNIEEIASAPHVEVLLRRLKDYDAPTYFHCFRTAEKMLHYLPYFPEITESRETLVAGCLLHDIGKISVPISILNKQGALTKEEWNAIKMHPEKGIVFLQDFPSEVKNICLLHHEKRNGTGYPYGYKSGQIPNYVQLVTVIDILDALMSHRPYHSPCKTVKELRAVMKESFALGELNVQYVDFVLKNLI